MLLRTKIPRDDTWDRSPNIILAAAIPVTFEDSEVGMASVVDVTDEFVELEMEINDDRLARIMAGQSLFGDFSIAEEG